MVKQEDLIERIVAKGYTKKDARIILADVIDTIIEANIEGEDVQIRGFGIFSVVDVKPREITNIQTGKQFVTEGHRAPKFTPSKTFRTIIRGCKSKEQE